MKLFQWSDSLKTGMSEIDRQHQELIARINVFAQASMAEPRDYAEMNRTFAFLQDYVIEHFLLEEELMDKYSYLGISLHQQDHAGFREWVEKVRRRLLNHEFPEDLVMEANYRLIEWLQLHIRNRDRVLSRFLQNLAEEKKIPSLLALILGHKE